ncbi:hypothetical protein TRAPUB_10151 [Trametes pubescens]|uniref:F-box domain-containing protein n=1 Tax=Trametes pubescens TaxID=154538 RepID=A0A1M2W0K0_TRAPU|nr:hypothetical protein TRAPUB_10151 [Trametes pubescens]
MYKWIKVAHVCRHWREIALNCANLWTWVAFDQHIPTSYSEMLLDRARGLPLMVTFVISDTMGHCEGCVNGDWFYDNFHDQTAEICSLVPRIRELRILIDRLCFEECWEDLLSAESDVLEVLRLEAFGKSRYTQLAIPPRGPSVSITEPLFMVPPPNLRSLSFAGVGCSWSETLLRPSLRHLELTSCQLSEPPNGSDMAAFLDAMRPLSNLETLKLDWPLFTDINEAGCSPVSLPRLTSIHLRGSNERIGRLLSYLQMLPTTTVRCTVLDSFFNERERKPFQTALAHLFENMTIHAVAWGTVPPIDPTGGDLTTMCQIWAVQGRGVRPPRDDLSWEAIVEADDPRLVLETGFRPSLDVVTPAALQALDLSYVEMIHVSGGTPSRSWARALKKAVNVQSLSVNGMAAFALPAVLAGGVPEDPEEDWQICLDNDVASADEWHWTAFDEDPPSAEHTDAAESDTAGVDETQPDGEVPGPGPPVFPKLHSLHILNVDIHLPHMPLDDLHCGEGTCYPHASDALFALFDAAGAKYGLSVSKLLKCLRVRAEQRASPIVRVDFEGCACADLGSIRWLAGAIPEVFWDDQLILPLEPGP